MPRPGGGGNPAVIKGSFKVLRGNSAVSRKFMFNPNDFNDTHPPTYGSLQVPGASHPQYQYGAGGERLISFDLYLDGDRGRANQRQKGVSTDSGIPLNVMDELFFYRGLVFPLVYGDTFANVFPPLVLFSFGPVYNNVRVIVKKADWKITYWTPKLEPVRAIVQIVLGESPTKSQTQDDIWNMGQLSVDDFST